MSRMVFYICVDTIECTSVKLDVLYSYGKPHISVPCYKTGLGFIGMNDANIKLT